jgi:pyruvate carboxylase subunit B
MKKYIAIIDGEEHAIDLDEAGDVAVCDSQHVAHLESADQNVLFNLLVGEVPHEVCVEAYRDSRYIVTIEGHRYEVQVADERSWLVREAAAKVREDVGEAVIRSPMPGLVVDVLVSEGQIVEAGDGVAILEAMKMENEIRAPQGGVVRSVHVESGQIVNLDDVIAHVGAPDSVTGG